MNRYMAYVQFLAEKEQAITAVFIMALLFVMGYVAVNIIFEKHPSLSVLQAVYIAQVVLFVYGLLFSGRMQ